jgi:hypothetical protein
VFVNLILDKSFPMSIDVVSPLRQRVIEDMTARKLSAGTQRLHISSCKRFAAFLQRSPETATVEDVRRFQLHLAETGTSIREIGRDGPQRDSWTAIGLLDNFVGDRPYFIMMRPVS